MSVFAAPLVNKELAGKFATEVDTTYYKWVRDHAPEHARFFADNDGLFYLHTGRTALSMRVPGDLVYAPTGEGITNFVRTMPAVARRFHLGYALFTGHDYSLDNRAAGQAGVASLAADTQRFELMFEEGETRVYAIRNEIATRR